MSEMTVEKKISLYKAETKRATQRQTLIPFALTIVLFLTGLANGYDKMWGYPLAFWLAVGVGVSFAGADRYSRGLWLWVALGVVLAISVLIVLLVVCIKSSPLLQIILSVVTLGRLIS